MTFDELGLHAGLLDGLKIMGFNQPTPVQEQAIPVALQSQDLIALAQTGTGKTAAFVLPIMHKILSGDSNGINTLILAPTRELVLQIDQQIEGLSYFTSISSISVYGGGDGKTWTRQKQAFESKADIIVATPGRLIAHLTSSSIKFDTLQHLVLDEADRMLDMGFYEDIMRIMSYLPKKKQILLFSATMSSRIKKLTRTILHNPKHISLAIAKPAEKIMQQVYRVPDAKKEPLLIFLLKDKRYTSVIVFVATKIRAKKLAASLEKKHLKVKAFHSDLSQQERERILGEYRSRKLPIIIGTDILSRGLDVEDIDLIVNFDVPADSEDYVHRVGRTARAERDGVAITFVNRADERKMIGIEKLIGKTIEEIKFPEHDIYGASATVRQKTDQ